VAIKCGPSLDMVRRSRSPLLSMNVTPLRSTVHPRPFCARCLFFQHVLSSPTHGWTKRPSRVHLCSVAVSAIVIRSIRVARFLRSVAGVLRPPTGLPPNFKRHLFTKGEWFANARAAIGSLLVRSGFASHASREPLMPSKMHNGGQSAGGSQFCGTY
jgi:hypothetical protein